MRQCPKCGKQMNRTMHPSNADDRVIQRISCSDPMCQVRFFEFVYAATPAKREVEYEGMQCDLCGKTVTTLIFQKDSIRLCKDCTSTVKENAEAMAHLKEICRG